MRASQTARAGYWTLVEVRLPCGYVQLEFVGVDRITAMGVAGHVTEKMWSKYSQVRIDSVREKLAEAF
jgi:hypothetical protein